jgi:hypothetical protein
MKAVVRWLFLLGLLIVSPPANAQFWEKKEWTSWSKSEAQRMLEDSPWAKKWTQAEVREVPFGQPTGGTERENRIQLYYIAQLRSASPVRMAVVRRAQFTPQYEKMSEAEKKAFAEQSAAFVNKTYEDVVVVHVVYGSNVQFYERAMANFWQGFPDGTVPINTHLITSKGKRVLPIRLISERGGAYEFELIFPRLVNERPLLDPDDKALRLEFPTPDIAGIEEAIRSQGGRAVVPQERTARAFIEFKTDKMIYKGKLEY